MKVDEFKFELRKKTPRLTAFFRGNYGRGLSEKDMRKALDRFAEIYLEEFLENADEVLFEPRRPEHKTLLALLPEGNIFNGGRPFSQDKLAAMIVYFVAVIGIKLSKTKLNKLAFYSDFRHFSKYGKSISGSCYKHLPHGPVVESYEMILSDLTKSGVIEMRVDDHAGSKAEMIGVLDASAAKNLTDSEKHVINSVAADFGGLTAAAVSDLSHAETAYRNTAMGEYIAYGFAELLKS